MPARTKLPADATLVQRTLYPFVRSFFYFFFAYLPYAPVRRVNQPDLSGPYLWASSHSNYLCDTIPAGYEGPCPTKFLAKSTLFRFPIKAFIEFCGALPVARAEDFRATTGSKDTRTAQNRSTFKVAIAALKRGWPVAIFPEGVSIVSPGLVLPLKPGVAKLGFSAEEAHDFSLNLRIIPVGLEYGSRPRVGSGLTVRYGQPIYLREYRERYQQDKEAAVREVMDRLTREMVSVFPHFRDETCLALGRKLVALGLCTSKFEAAQLFLRRGDEPGFWAGLEMRMRAFEEANKERAIPVPAWGHRRAWKELGPRRRRVRWALILAGMPLALFDLVNNTVPEFCISSLVEYLSVDETEKMSLRFMLSPVVLTAAYGAQFTLGRQLSGEMAGWSWFAAYLGVSFVSWYLAVHWRRQFKRVASLYFFRRAGIQGRAEAMAYYRSLRQYLR